MKINFRFSLLLTIACLTLAQTCFALIMTCETPADYNWRSAADIAGDILVILGAGVFLTQFIFDISRGKRQDAGKRREIWEKCIGWSFFLVLLAMLFHGVQQCVM